MIGCYLMGVMLRNSEVERTQLETVASMNWCLVAASCYDGRLHVDTRRQLENVFEMAAGL